MTAVRVVKFTIEPKSTNGGYLVLEADDTEAIPPINFNPKK